MALTPADRMPERTLQSRAVFRGRLLGVEVLRVALGDGRTGRREIVHHPGAVAVLCRRPDGRFVMVRQYRKPVERVLLEVVAGCLHPGEPPARCARREVREETGYRVRRLRRLGLIYPTPGYCDERLHLFFAELEAAPAAQSLDEDERVAPVAIAAPQLERLIRGGRIRDAKTLAAWLMYKGKQRDRADAGLHKRA